MVVEKEIEEISKETGIPENKIYSMFEDWVVPLMKKGLIVDLKLKRWRSLQKISVEDTGLQDEDPDWEIYSNNYVQWGQKIIFPKKIIGHLNGIESKARSCLRDHGIKTIWGFFVPFSAYFKWKEENEKIKKEYFDYADYITDNYEKIKEEAIEEHKKHAKVLYEKSKKEMSYEDFENQFTMKIRLAIPSSSDFRSTFSYENIFFFIPIPSEIKKEIKEVEKQSLEIEKIRREREDLDYEVAIRERIMEETISLKKEHIEKFLETTVGEIRSTIINIINEVRNSLSSGSGNVVTGKSRTKLLNMIEKVKILDFYNDSQINEFIEQLKIDLNKDVKDRSEDEIMITLENLEKAAKSSIKNLVKGKIGI